MKKLVIFAMLMFSFQNISAAEFLADRHVKRGNSCQQCHVNGMQTAPTYKECFQCHKGFQELADRTAEKEINVHDTHFGDMECNSCHKAHGQGSLMCTECHGKEFTSSIKVP